MTFHFEEQGRREMSKAMTDGWLADEAQDSFVVSPGVSSSKAEDVFTTNPISGHGSNRVFDAYTQPSSSTDEGTLEACLLRILRGFHRTLPYALYTSGRLGILEALKRSISVNSSEPNKNVFEIRRLTGFSSAKLADLLNVSTPIVNEWIGGGRVDPRYYGHIANTLSVLRFSDRGTSERNEQILGQRSASGYTPLEEIKNGNYQFAKQLLGYGESRPEIPRSSSVWDRATGEFQPLLEIEDEVSTSSE